MNVPKAIIEAIEPIVGRITSASSVSGGCINNGAILVTQTRKYFLKWNFNEPFDSMLQLEATGLNTLRAATKLNIPKVIHHGRTGDHQYLVLECISSNIKAKSFWIDFARGLAELHKTSNEYFGLDYDNYIGSLPQKNSPSKKWSTFYAEHRIMNPVKFAVDSGRIPYSLNKRLETLCGRLDGLLPEESPSLLHGDLWAGNLLTDEDGLPCMIDPAIYYGNREVDLAMTMLFGGFNSEYLAAYNEVFPLQKGFHERLPLYQIYPLLVHVNLFGESYLPQLDAIVSKYV